MWGLIGVVVSVVWFVTATVIAVKVGIVCYKGIMTGEVSKPVAITGGLFGGICSLCLLCSCTLKVVKMMENKTIAACTDAIRLNPHDAAAYYQRGDAYYDINNYDAAIADFTQAIRLNPNYDEAYHLRGVSYFIKDDYDAAITDFTEAVRLDPNNADYKDILAEALRKKEGD